MNNDKSMNKLELMQVMNAIGTESLVNIYYAVVDDLEHPEYIQRLYEVMELYMAYNKDGFFDFYKSVSNMEELYNECNEVNEVNEYDEYNKEN